ncbi:MAG: hypothetical protein LC794_12965 [Acidobacteria bacterium]|nr:hypothetical protein [Acidobacteriota bacterium]
MKKAINTSVQKKADKSYRERGFTVEDKGSFTIYRKPVSQDTVEASRLFSKRQIGYRSTDIPGKRCK